MTYPRAVAKKCCRRMIDKSMLFCCTSNDSGDLVNGKHKKRGRALVGISAIDCCHRFFCQLFVVIELAIC